ncbi:GTPase HflX [Wenzhouxiangella sp. AB-CW3]|uniref:ribosome rescue GTPase HflX n=1 Tax=Wenzhouxiangella sp. AB-CW3 TaxID=2771012 RepID=UPI00168BCA3A|nr:ribosome rescue GTPase HflX [Wenzhouxiangella sp. AB-CW3]QOC21662.1 GTPase HflX [Wenzhouxiangella sp. AB-CW3]
MLLLHPVFEPVHDEESRLEFRLLAKSAGLDTVAELTAPRSAPDPKYLVGSGKVEEVRSQVVEHEADLVLVNARLTPVQERNLARALKCNVLDRTTLILDIFAQRARSHEGKLQVELAQLRHLSTRLVRGWTHLERQRGGIGMRGPGETQLETDRRLLGNRIRQLTARLEKVQQRRDQGRRARQRGDVPLVALVGYTNAGKSTLFNRLTSGEVMARDQLFATLDPTVRRIDSLNGSTVLMSDTVGFIRDLPHELVAAFRSTLEETLSASLVVHVIDAADGDRLQQQAVVEEVLDDIGAGDLPSLKVFNKVDLADRDPGMERDEQGRPSAVWISAVSGEGLDLLAEAFSELLAEGRIRRWIHVPVQRQRLRARLFELGVVREEEVEDDGSSRLDVDLDLRDVRRLTRLDGADGKLAEQLLLN